MKIIGETIMKRLFIAFFLLMISACGAAEEAAPVPEAPVSEAPVTAPEATPPVTEAAVPEREPEPVVPTPELVVTVFTASDLDPSVAQAVEESLALAVEAWGLFWPTEYWVMGTDPEAGVALVEEFCERREFYKQWSYEECMAREASEQEHSLLDYQRVGATALANNERMSSAGWNGSPEWGIHRFASTIPWGLAEMMGVPGSEDVKTVFHEYWHALQNSYIDTSILYKDREELMGPVWFIEGSAEYRASYLAGSLMANGEFPEVPSGEWTWEFVPFMRNKLGYIDDELRGTCQGVTLTQVTTYGTPCSYPIGYEMGAWAIAYLEHRSKNPNILQDVFYPQLQEVGWNQAFETTFGQTVADFDTEFMTFFTSTNRERILPTF